MVYAFTESEKQSIESRGMMVAEFKRMLDKMKRLKCALGTATKFWQTIEEVSKKLSEFFGILGEALDKIKFVIQEHKDNIGCNTSQRYKIVKFLSRASGIEKMEVWKMTRHTHLARSCC